MASDVKVNSPPSSGNDVTLTSSLESNSQSLLTGSELRAIMIAHPDSIPDVIVSLKGRATFEARRVFQDEVERLEKCAIDVRTHLVAVKHDDVSVELPLLHWAAVFGRFALIDWLIGRPGYGALDRNPASGGTILHSFICYGSGLRLKAGVEKNAVERFVNLYDGCLIVADNDGNTPLLLAIRYLLHSGNAELAEFYVKTLFHRAYVVFTDIRVFLDTQDNRGNTALHLLAPFDQYNALVKFLLANGASPSVCNVEKRSPFAVASVSEAELNATAIYRSLCPSSEKEESSEPESCLQPRRKRRKSSESLYLHNDDLPESPPISAEKKRKKSLESLVLADLPVSVEMEKSSKSKFTRKTPVVAKGSETNGKTSDGDGHLLGSLVKAGLLDHVVQSARKRRKKAQEELSTHAKDIKVAKKQLRVATQDINRRLEGIRAKNGEVGTLLIGLNRLRQTEKSCMERRDEAEKKVREIQSRIVHCDNVIAHAPLLDV